MVNLHMAEIRVKTKCVLLIFFFLFRWGHRRLPFRLSLELACGIDCDMCTNRGRGFGGGRVLGGCHSLSYWSSKNRATVRGRAKCSQSAKSQHCFHAKMAFLKQPDKEKDGHQYIKTDPKLDPFAVISDPLGR